MKLLINLVLLIALIAAPLTSVGLAATKSKRRQCTVYLVGGEIVQGGFVSASSAQMIVEVEGVRKTIKLDHVANIVFVVDFKNRRVDNNQR
jgi:tagatose-1,6-bisphosphate aldolase non-catalytic subunit AgaZ/GatZ